MTIGTISNNEDGIDVRTKLNLAIAAINAGVTLNLKTDFGAAGDGTTNDTAAFNAFRTYALTQNPRWIELHIPPGDYLCVHAQWMKGIQNLVVWAYGATFTNVGVAGALDQGYQYGSDTVTCAFGGNMWQETTDPLDGFAESVYPPVTGVATPYVINTVAAGSATVTTTTAGHAGNFSVGDDVFVYGYNQQGGDSFPPNPKYFECKKVVSVDAGTGVITLDSVLNHRYRSDWTTATFYLVPCGAARILNLTRTSYQYCQNIVFYGGTFLPYSGLTNQFNGTIYPGGAKNITLVDVVAKGCLLGDCENFHALRCNFIPDSPPYSGDGSNESDKGCDRAIYEECVMHDHIQGSGVNYLEFLRCTLTGQFQARSRHLVLKGNKMSTVFGSGGNMTMGSLSGYSSRMISAEDNRFIITNAGMTGIFGDALDLPFVVNTVPSATEFTVVKATYPDLVFAIDQESRIHTYDVASYATGIVTDFYEDATLLHVVGRWNRTLVAGNTLHLLGAQRLYERGNSIINKPDGSTKVTSIFRPYTFLGGAAGASSGTVRTDRYIDSNAMVEKIQRPTILKTLGYYNENVNGFVTKIVVHVQRAYTGSDTNCDLQIAHEGGNSQRVYGNVDCKTVGLREWNIVGYSTPLGGDDSFATINGTYCDALQMLLSSDTSAGSSEQLPLVSVWIEAVPAI